MKSAFALLLVLAAASAGAAAPVQVPVQIDIRADQGCSATLEPGHAPLASAFPDAEPIYKRSDVGRHVQSCEMRVRKDAFLKAYSYCALSSSLSAESCAMSLDFEGGRRVQFTVISNPDPQAPQAAVCGYTCLPR